jgi:acetyltransferase-like isoleucine patch superfamily enzyme
LIRKLLEAAVRAVKRDPSYDVAAEIPNRGIAIEIGRRATALVRGQWAFRGVAGGRLRFAEEGVRIRHRYGLTIGQGSVVEAHARIDALSRSGVRIGRGVTIGKFAIIEATSVLWNVAEGLEIGDGSSVGDYSFIGSAGGVVIGSNVLMGQRVSIHSENHNYDDPHRLIRDQGVSHEGVVIGDDCWLGSGAVILDGVTLGAGSVVAAGAVVTKSFPRIQSSAESPPARSPHGGRATPPDRGRRCEPSKPQPWKYRLSPRQQRPLRREPRARR